MSTFEDRLADHLSTELKVDVQDVLDAMNSFGINEKQSAPSKKKVPKSNEVVKTSTKKAEPPKIVSQKKNAEVHTCERIKKGQTDECGKNAKRELKVNGVMMWLCGADKSGCYAAAVKSNIAKDIEIEVNEAKITKGTKKPAPKGVSSKADAAKSLINKITPEDMKTATVKTSKGKLVYETTRRYLWDSSNNEFYGVLGDDNETIIDFKPEDIKWIEAHNHIVRSTKKRETLRNREDKKDKEAAEEKAKTKDVATKEKEKKKDVSKGKVETVKKADVEKTKKSKKVDTPEPSEDSSTSSSSSSSEKEATDASSSSEKEKDKDSTEESSSSGEGESSEDEDSGSDEPSESSEESGTTDD